MKIILLQDVKKLGKKGDIIEASDGYAKNYIIPQKLGVPADAKGLNDLKVEKHKADKKAQELLDAATALSSQLDGKKVSVKMKAGEGGRVFGSVSTKEIAAAVQEQLGVTVDKKKMQLSDPIKSFGTTEVPIKLHPQVTATIKVHVEEA